MHYRTINIGSSCLASRHVGYLYELTNPLATESIYCCLPKRTICITITLDGVYSIYRNHHWEIQPYTTIFGLLTERQFIRMSPHYREITIGFHPHSFQMFNRNAMSDLAGQITTDLAFVFDRPEIDRLVSALSTSRNDTEIGEQVARFLDAHFMPEKNDGRLYTAYDLVNEHTIYSVDALSDRLNLSTSRLRTLFRMSVGFTPKELIRLSRIGKALESGAQYPGRLANLAYDLDYFDQSHFIHDFRQTMGMTPTAYFKNPELMLDFYNFSRLRLSSFASSRPELALLQKT